MSDSLVKQLLETGVHFGHKSSNWNPKMDPYIFGKKGGIHIIDVRQTIKGLLLAKRFLTRVVAGGKDVLFVGTKRQAQEIVREAAGSVNMPFCVDRWLGGTLTNFATVKASIAKYKKYQAMDTSGDLQKLGGKEQAAIRREMVRMQKNFSGISEMTDLPKAMFIIDVAHEDIAVAEGVRCKIPTIALVDTNSDPTNVTYPIPGNDDAVKSIRVIVDTIVEAVQNGLGQRDARRIAKGQADLKAATAAVAAAAEAAEDQPVPAADVTETISDEVVIPAAAKRKKIAAPKDDSATEEAPASAEATADKPAAAEAAPAPEATADKPAAEEAETEEAPKPAPAPAIPAAPTEAAAEAAKEEEPKAAE